MKFVRVTKVIKEISLDESLKHSTSFFITLKTIIFMRFDIHLDSFFILL